MDNARPALYYRGEDWYLSASQHEYWLHLRLESGAQITVICPDDFALLIRDWFLKVENTRHEQTTKMLRGED